MSSRLSRSCLTGAVAGILLAAGAAGPVLAQSSPGYFIPPTASSSGSSGAPAAAPRPVHHAARPAPAPAPVPQMAPSPAAATSAQTALPPIPQLTALPKVPPPPTSVIGVLSVPEVMQKSTAAQGVQEIIRDRQAALGGEAQKARTKIQNEQARIVAQRGKLTEPQLEAKEKALQDEISTTQTSFQARNQAIQNSGQAALGQIEAELIAVIRQVAQAHGMNLVLHREQVALNVDDFDITNNVVTQLNKLLPAVPVPPSVVTPGMPIDTSNQADSGQ